MTNPVLLPIIQVFLLSFGFYFPDTITPTEVKLHEVDPTHQQFILEVPQIHFGWRYDARQVWQIGVSIDSVKDYLEQNYGKTLDYYTYSYTPITFNTYQGHTVPGTTYRCAIVPDYFGQPLSSVINYGATVIPNHVASDINGVNSFNFTLYTVDLEDAPEIQLSATGRDERLLYPEDVLNNHMMRNREVSYESNTEIVYDQLMDIIASLKRANIPFAFEKVKNCLKNAIGQ